MVAPFNRMSTATHEVHWHAAAAVVGRRDDDGAAAAAPYRNRLVIAEFVLNLVTDLLTISRLSRQKLLISHPPSFRPPSSPPRHHLVDHS